MSAHAPAKTPIAKRVPTPPTPPLRRLTAAERAAVEEALAEGKSLRETVLLVGIPRNGCYSKALAEKVSELRAAGATWDAIGRRIGIDIGSATCAFAKSIAQQGVAVPKRPAPNRDTGPSIGKCPRCGKRITLDGGFSCVGGQKICPACASRRFRRVNIPNPDSPYPGT